jgi:hypothetical protein
MSNLPYIRDHKVIGYAYFEICLGGLKTKVISGDIYGYRLVSPALCR